VARLDRRLEALGVSKAYPGVKALDDVTLGVGAGEIVGLVGHNGAGKSTLTRILAGAERPDKGELRLDGKPIAFRSPDDAIGHGIALVPQQLMIAPNLSVRENLLLGRRGPLARKAHALLRRDTNGRTGWARWEEVVDELRLAAVLDIVAGRLRPPVQRLTLIGRALLRDPRVLMLDEPSAAFSEPEVELLFSILRPLRDQGIAVLYITHRLDEVLEFTDRVIVLRQGKKVHEGQTEGLAQDRLTEMVVGRRLERTAPLGSRAAAAARDDSLLECEGLSVLPRVRDVSFTLYRGEVVGITGVVGSGRTTFLRALCGVERRNAGEIRLQGRRLRLRSPRDAVRAGIAFMPEDRIRNAVIPDMTVAENVTLPQANEYRFNRFVPLLNLRHELTAVNAVLDQLEVAPPHSARVKIKFLSGGNQQKAMLARWLLAGAKVFIFDEPTEGIDVGTRFAIYDLIRGLAQQGAGVIVSSSDVEEIVSISDRVLIMRRGELVRVIEGADITESIVSHACIA
jgi:ABC-type sugar transport system ATPase subunit